MKKGKIISIKEEPENINFEALRKEASKNKEELFVSPLKSVVYHTIIDDIQPEFASALLRSTVAEQEHYALDVDYSCVERTDENIDIPHFITILKLIPLKIGLSVQDIDNINMCIDIYNDTSDTIIVKSGDIKFTGKYKPERAIFPPTIELTNLEAGCRLKVKKIKIINGISFHNSSFLLGTTGRIWPEEIPGTKYKISFNVNCVSVQDTNVASRLLRSGALNIIERLLYLKNVIEDDNKILMKTYDSYIEIKLTETNTIAKLLDKACILLYPTISNISTILTYHSGEVLIRVVAPDAKKILKSVIESCIDFYKDISKQLESQSKGTES